jgi:hypothetical protein
MKREKSAKRSPAKLPLLAGPNSLWKYDRRISPRRYFIERLRIVPDLIVDRFPAQPFGQLVADSADVGH